MKIKPFLNSFYSYCFELQLSKLMSSPLLNKILSRGSALLLSNVLMIFLTTTTVITVSAQTKRKVEVTYMGQVRDESGYPLTGATVTSKSGNSTTTDAGGNFTIKGIEDDKLTVTFLGYSTTSKSVSSSSKSLMLMMGSGDSISPSSYWIGASLAYSLNQQSDNGTDNIIGGASVFINPLKEGALGKTTFGVIGNIGNFTSTQDVDATSLNLSKLALSSAGLSLGVSAIWNLTDPKNTFPGKIFLSSMYKLNSYKVEGDQATTSINQWRNVLGVEFEGLDFKNDGKLHLGLAASYGIFDETAFKKVFKSSNTSIWGLDASIILPLSKNFGFMFNGCYTQYATPIYTIGMIVKASQ